MSCFNGILKVFLFHNTTFNGIQNNDLKFKRAKINSKPFFIGLEINGAISLKTFNLMLIFFVFITLMGQFI